MTINGSSLIHVTNGMATLSGGTIAGTGELRVTSGTVVFGAGGTGAITARGTTTLQGNLRSGHQLNLEGIVGTPAFISFTGNLTNAGSIDVSANLGASATLAVSGATGLINTGDLTFSGSGAASASRTLQGRLSNTTTGVTTVEENSSFNSPGADHTNAGQMMIESGATLTVLGGVGTNFTNTSTGILRGSGTLHVAATDSGLANQGTVAPGQSAGILTVTGNYAQQASGRLAVEIGGTTAGSQYDRLAVSGSASLNGALDVALINGFMPAAGQVFDIIDWTTRSGTFASVNLPVLSPGHEWNSSELYTTGTLSVDFVGIAGDYNNNRAVDAADYVVWRENKGTNNILPNDGGLPGPVGEAHYNQWRAHFGQSASASTATGSAGSAIAVPEPAALLLLLFGSIMSLTAKSR